ncbi:hypothetical protein BU15DRAFT_90631 [Melanogaster broomeanus]|nr:hypothetical protein BU15DRAFT_90631 [Melanogaster broomeanus]
MSSDTGFVHPQLWKAGEGVDRYQWSCLACKDNKWRDIRSAHRHEKQTLHKHNVEYQLSCSPSPPLEVRGPLLELLRGLSDRPPPDSAPISPPSTNPALLDSDEVLQSFELDWDAINHEELMPGPLLGEASVATLAGSLANWIAGGDQDASSGEDSDGPPESVLQNNDDGDPNWYPWPDKLMCVLDILRHLPRSLFSDAQMQVILWGLSVLGVDDVLLTRVLKDLDESLQHQTLGHVYYANHLPSIIAQEMANPRVRPHLHHYPEDAGQHLSQPWQASRWRHEIDPTLATPMIRIDHQDFYVFEPAKLKDGRISSGTGSARCEQFWAHAWRAHPVGNGEDRGYVVHKYETVEVPANELLLSFPGLVATYEMDELPDPRCIIGIIAAAGSGVLPWVLSNPVVGNRWCSLSRGHRVYSYMMWLYCDDTSGNISKQWNKHNSFLCTAAGLPRSMVHKESNIHFLATSNIAPPLEMLDGIVSQLEDAQACGIWAWDVVAKEMVLIIPAVLAVLGDNPMQSELACHVGLQGKFFCRNCWVKGRDTADEDLILRATSHSDDTNSVHSNSQASGSEVSVTTPVQKTKGRRKETLQELVDRARRFLGDNQPRDRDETVNKLRSMFQNVATTGIKSHYQKAKTDSGLKDTFMEFFVDQIFKPLKGLHEAFMSLIWRIKGLDPHQDTPVEILHVILLGFIKYFWRDAMSRLSDDQKTLLQIRLNSFDVSGLGIPRLAGHTLAAPFVLYDLVPRECYDTFVALSTLIPLVWQPIINNVDVHLDCMQESIDHFLNCTARWTPRWFNKPKFHLIRHLPDHVHCFGPPILFATEGFEAFNAVVRDHSVHSNRQAPSRDIGRGFARCNQIRHFLSGGRFMSRLNLGEGEQPFSDEEKDWRVVGSYAMALGRLQTSVSGNVIADYYGLSDDTTDDIEPGMCIQDKSRPRTVDKTSAEEHLPGVLPVVSRRLYQTCSSVMARNGDACERYQFVFANDPRSTDDTHPLIGRLSEILQVCHSSAQRDGRANYVLLELFRIAGTADIYQLPLLQCDGWKLLPASSLLCTVNVQHNCAAHQCRDTAFSTIFEEREATSKTKVAIEHQSPDDLVLNTTQMRDAIHVQSFRTQAECLDREWAIHAGATAEVEAQKLKASKEQTRATKKSTKGRLQVANSNVARGNSGRSMLS